MLRIILLAQVLLLAGCFNSTTGGLTPNQDGSGAVIVSGNDDHYDNSMDGSIEQDSVAIIDKGVITDGELLDDEVAPIEQKRQKVVETRLESYQSENNVELAFVVYFEFDSTDISENSLLDISKHADFLKQNTDIKLRLLGHTDERGSREYNLALGENRALAVSRVLKLYNIDDIEVVSYGEESPVDSGSNEQAWALNRRVQFVYF